MIRRGRVRLPFRSLHFSKQETPRRARRGAFVGAFSVSLGSKPPFAANLDQPVQRRFGQGRAAEPHLAVEQRTVQRGRRAGSSSTKPGRTRAGACRVTALGVVPNTPGASPGACSTARRERPHPSPAPTPPPTSSCAPRPRPAPSPPPETPPTPLCPVPTRCSVRLCRPAPGPRASRSPAQAPCPDASP